MTGGAARGKWCVGSPQKKMVKAQKLNPAKTRDGGALSRDVWDHKNFSHGRCAKI